MRYFIRFGVPVFLAICSTSLFSSSGRTVLPSGVGNGSSWLAKCDTISFYYEDFESVSNWVSIDLTDIPGVWHSDTFQAYEDSGKSWWMGDPEVGGYLDHWYQVLDSPEIILPATGCTLRFAMNRAVESPTGADPPYDGWDGFNVRISTDAGSSWTVLEGPTPDYNCTSMYSFGFEHGEGPGIPGWGGSSGGWVDVIFDLSDYANDTVKIRWAFASDPAYCTSDNPTLFGVQVDNIDVAGVFTNDGEDTTGFSCSSLVPVGGDLWHIAEDESAPSPTHAAYCGNDSSGTYNPNMYNAYVSPLIPLPEADTIIADFWLRGGFGDPDEWPECDYFGVELSPDSGSHWYAVSNPTGDSGGMNYVYLMPPNTPWAPFSEAFGEPPFIDVSMYAGGVVQFRVWLHSDSDTPIGEGIFIDDFVLSTVEAGIEEFSNSQSTIINYQLSVYPNPFSQKTVIRYSLNENRDDYTINDLRLTIYDICGRVAQQLPITSSSVTLGKELKAGIYFLGVEGYKRVKLVKLR